jgi:hypothetical protein
VEVARRWDLEQTLTFGFRELRTEIYNINVHECLSLGANPVRY